MTSRARLRGNGNNNRNAIGCVNKHTLLLFQKLFVKFCKKCSTLTTIGSTINNVR